MTPDTIGEIEAALAHLAAVQAQAEAAGPDDYASELGHLISAIETAISRIESVLSPDA